MERLSEEGLISIDDAVALFPYRISRRSAFRWAKHGVGGVLLESTCVGVRRFTSREAVRRFIEAVTAARTCL
jgi:hypothetical protein